MSTMVQIRNVPVELHRQLKTRAATEGLTMSDFVLREVRKALQRPSREVFLARLAARPVRVLKESAASAVRKERDAR